ncbi:hypothetical protein GCM10018779_61070 [Streptomyces griseocarneus]|nr:hypothetical protein GCM10018779_61070 [Streptomyces griseocarneus]
MRRQLTRDDFLPEIAGDAKVCGLITEGHVHSQGVDSPQQLGNRGLRSATLGQGITGSGELQLSGV